MKQELNDWLNANKISFQWIEDDVLEVSGFGKLLFHDMEKQTCLLKGKDEDIRLNILEDPEELIDSQIFYACFKFGNNWYYTDLRAGFKLNILKYIGDTPNYTRKEKFVNLGAHSPYELMNGSFLPAEWVKKAKWLGHDAIGLCDSNTMAGLFPLQKECKEITPVFGYSLAVKYDGGKLNGKVYCQTQQGLKNMLRIQKAVMVDSEDKTITLQELKRRAPGNCFVFSKDSIDTMIGNPDLVEDIMNAFNQDVYYQFDVSEYKANTVDIKALENAKKYIREVYLNDDSVYVRPVLISDCYYLDADDFKNKKILNDVDKRREPQSVDQYFKDVDQHYETLKPLFQKLIDEENFEFDEFFSYICSNSCKIAEEAEARFETGKMFMPEYGMKQEEIEKYGDRLNMFMKLLDEGMNELIPVEDHARYQERLDYEVYVIKSTGNVDYFLVQWDIMNWTRKNDVLTAYGRGSAGGALVSYLLHIIKIDPLKYGLIFERFLLPERGGLEADEVTILKECDPITGGMVEVSLGENKIYLKPDAIVKVKTAYDELTYNGGEVCEIRADELVPGDDLILDNNDILWNVKYSK